MIEGIHDRDGHPIREDARVRVRYPSAILPGREVTYLGTVFGTDKAPVGGEEREVILVRTKSGGERIALPEHCRVRRVSKATREAKHRTVKRKLAVRRKPKRIPRRKRP